MTARGAPATDQPAAPRPERPAAPRVQRLETLSDLGRITFTDGLAAVMVPIGLIERIPFRNDGRARSPRMLKLERSIRAHGYDNAHPIVARIGRKGRWVIMDGGHRLTAARRIAREWLTNLAGPKVRSLYFLLFTTDASWSKIRAVTAAAAPDTLLPEMPSPALLDEDEAA